MVVVVVVVVIIHTYIYRNLYCAKNHEVLAQDD